MLYLGAHKVSKDARHDRQELTIGHRGNAPDMSLMPADEFQMRNERLEVLPAGEGFGVDHEAGKLPVCRNEWIDLACDQFKVGFFKRTLGRDDQDSAVTKQFKMDHGSSPFKTVALVNQARNYITRCVSAGNCWRTSAMRAGSTSPTTTPRPSSCDATMVPHGSISIECPHVRRPFGCSPPCAAAST